MAVQTLTLTPELKRLRRWLLTDVAASTVFGLGLVATSSPTARILGVDRPLAVAAAGGGALAYATWLSWAATPDRVRPGLGYLVGGGNVALLVGGVALLLAGWPPTTTGKWGLAGTTLGVAALAVLELDAVQRTKGTL